MRLYEVPGGREMILNRIRTPLTDEEIRQGLLDGRISPVMYRKQRQTKRDPNGLRIYDIMYDEDTGEETVEIERVAKAVVIIESEEMGSGDLDAALLQHPALVGNIEGVDEFVLLVFCLIF